MLPVYVYWVNGGETQFEEEVFIWIINNATKSIYHKYLRLFL